MAACGIDLAATPQLHQVDVWTSHEGLLLDYEEGLTRRDSFTGDWYDCSAHMLWIGERTRALDGAHVEFFSGVHNPIGVQARARGATPEELVELCERLEPRPHPRPADADRAPRRRAGRASCCRRSCAPSREAGHPVVWACDPMHANGFRTAGGRKTRHFDAIMAEIEGFFAACRAEGVWPGGVHLEYTGDNVTECLGGSEELAEEHLDARYETLCDPRLNGRQALDLAFRLAELMRRHRSSVAVQRLTIVGTGLIGASLGLAARAPGPRVRRLGPRPGRARGRRRRAARSTPAASLDAALAGADLVVVAAPDRGAARGRSPRVLARDRRARRRSPTSARPRRASSRPPAARRGSSAATRSPARRRAAPRTPRPGSSRARPGS